MSNHILETHRLTKSFSGVIALENFYLALDRGEIRAIVGENGAGKSTLINTLVGAHKPDYGDIIVNGNKETFNSPVEANQKGISAVFQELSIVDNLSIAENIFINRQPTMGPNIVNTKKLYENTKKILEKLNMDHINPKTLVGNLSAANKQQVEILKALSYNPSIMILDEPTSSLSDVETKMLFATMRTLKEHGVALIYISHHLKEIFEIADTVTIMRDGRKVCDKQICEVDEAFLISNMVGREINDIYGTRCDEISDEVMLEVDSISRRGNFENVSFNIRKGEIVAFAGLVGAGRTEVALALFGCEPHEKGKVYLEGKQVSINSPTQAVKLKIGYVTENRKLDGLFLNHSIRANIVANKLDEYSMSGTMNDRKIKKRADELKDSFNIVCRAIDQQVVSLSGGNQQKVLLSTWFDINPKLLIIDEPTRGVDVGAKTEIYKQIRALAQKGTAIMLISSDLMEVLGMADRIIVMREGRITSEINAKEASEESILACAISE